MTSRDGASDAAQALLEASLRLATAARGSGAVQLPALLALTQQIQAEAEAIEATVGVGARKARLLTEAYVADARQSARYVAILYAGVALTIVTAAGLLIVGLVRTATLGPTADGDFRAYALSAFILGLLSLPLWWQSERHRKSVADNRRLAHQWSALDDYLQPLPERPQAIMRAALAPRMFSRPIEDEDPLKEPVWPSAELLYPPVGGGDGSR